MCDVAMKNGEIKSNKSPKISENGGSSCIDQYQAHQRDHISNVDFPFLLDLSFFHCSSSHFNNIQHIIKIWVVELFAYSQGTSQRSNLQKHKQSAHEPQTQSCYGTCRVSYQID